MKMENLNYLFIGSSSELAEETLNLFSKKGFKVYGVSRRVNDISHFEDFLVVNDYLKELDKIIQFTEKINNCCVVFFNGFLAENRSEEVPSINEIVETDLANFNVPYSLTKALKEKTNSINKYIYISSIAAVKPRNKNYIYGLSKRKLEIGVEELKLDNYLILRFGKILTEMSKNHKNSPFTLNKSKAAEAIFNNKERSGIIYPIKGLFFMSLIIKFLPRKIINYIEK